MAIVTNWKTGVSGNWSDATKWDNGVPNAAGTTANIIVAGTYTVTVNGGENFTVDTLNLNSVHAILQNNGDLIVDIAANITSGTFNENGTLDLTNGGGTGATATVAAGGKLNLSNADVIGGTLAGPGAIKLTGNSTTTFDGTGASGLSIAADATVQVLDGSRLSFGGPANSASTIANAGTITLNAVSGQALLTIDNQVTLTGGGNIVLSDANNGNNQIYSDASGSILDNVNNTISGAGTIQQNAGLAITNEVGGTINANSASFALNINNITVTNAGLVEGTNAGGLNLNSMTLDDSGGGTLKAVGAGNAVNLSSSTVRGGTLTTTGGGVIQTSGGTSNFDVTPTAGVTISPLSLVNVSDNTTLQLTGLTGLNKVGTLNNAGTLTLGAATNTSLLAILNHVKLTGGGQVVLSDAGNGNNQIYSQAGGSTLENVDNTISGAGTIQQSSGLAITNDVGGTIDANSTAFALNINSITVTNKGVVESTGTAGLDLNSMTLDGTGGGTLKAAGANSVVNLGNSTIRGGTLTTTGGGFIQTTPGTSNLDLTAPTNGAVTITAGSTLNVSNNTTLQVTGLTGSGRVGTLNNMGTIGVNAGANTSLLSFNNQVKLQGGGQIVLTDSANNQIYSQTGGSTLENVDNTISGAGTIQPNAGLAITNDVGGTFNATGTNALNISTPFTNKGTLEAAAGSTLNLSGTDTVGGTIAGAGTVALTGTSTFNNLSLAGSGTLDVVAALGSTTGGVSFAAGSTETLELDASVIPAAGGAFLNPIAGFAAGDKIDLRGLVFGGNSTPTYSGTTLTVREGGSTDTLTLTTPTGMTFTAADDTHGGTILSVTCFGPGTRIRTVRGDVLVEALAVGDLVATSGGSFRPIRWLGHRTIDCRNHPCPQDVMPIRILAHAFGENRPARDLYLSPGHPVLVDADEDNAGGHLVPIMCLINGTTIERVAVDEVTYWHIELDEHDILLAEGLPAESYIDLGSRPWFAGSDGAIYDPDMALPGMPGRCRPVAIDGPVIEAERRRLDAVFAMRLEAACAWPVAEDHYAFD